MVDAPLAEADWNAELPDCEPMALASDPDESFPFAAGSLPINLSNGQLRVALMLPVDRYIRNITRSDLGKGSVTGLP